MHQCFQIIFYMKRTCRSLIDNQSKILEHIRLYGERSWIVVFISQIFDDYDFSLNLIFDNEDCWVDCWEKHTSACLNPAFKITIGTSTT